MKLRLSKTPNPRLKRNTKESQISERFKTPKMQLIKTQLKFLDNIVF